MKKLISILLIVLVLVISCEKIPSEPEVPPEERECIADDDCVTGGCSGTICQSKNAEPIFTTCEYLPEYACYKEIKCGCINGKCQWDKTEEFNKCVEEARKLDREVVV